MYSNDSETVWNAFRLGHFALKNGEQVKVFLLAKGMECESLTTNEFPIAEQMQLFIDAGGHILACGTCLKIRQSEGTALCPLSTMQDLYDLIKESNRVVSF